MGIYKYREVLCPWCKHQFMWHEGPVSKPWIEYVNVAYVEKPAGFGAKCPKCSKELIVVKGKIKGLFPDKAREIFLPGFKGD